MAQKHLHELLQEDQEPFHLNNYIADRRSQIKTSTQLQLKKRKPMSPAASTFPANLCKNACLFSLTNSPDIRKSPLFEFKSPVRRSPCKSPNNLFLHVPARTAALLLDAALRIQNSNKNNNNNNNHSTKNKSSGFGLLGSMLKKLKQKSKTQKSSVKDMLKLESFVSRKSFDAKNNLCEVSTGRPSSAAWSESNEERKSLDMGSSSSCSSSSTSHSADDFEFLSKHQQRDDLVYDCFETDFCESPFHFVLQRSPSPSRRTPEFSSPAASPGSHCRKQEKEIFEDVKSLKKFPGEGEEEEDDEDDQFSPVSVLDPPFHEYEERHDGDYEDEDDEGYGIKCSYDKVQRAKQQLLQKLHRFEKLAGLDPIELEKRIFEQEYDGDETNHLEEEGECSDNEFDLSEQIINGGEIIMEVCWRANMFKQHYIPKDMKRLISDLIAEEEQIQSGFFDNELTVKRVCKRLESWKEVQYNTIDMMVEQDFKSGHDWKNYQNHVGEVATEVELAVLELLVGELSEELMQ